MDHDWFFLASWFSGEGMARALSAAVREQGHDLGTCVAGSKHRDSDLILLGHYLVPHEGKDSGLVIGHQIYTTVRDAELGRDIVPELWVHLLWRSSFCFGVLYGYGCTH